MRQPSYIYRGYMAIGQVDIRANGRINGNFCIQAVKPFGEIVFRTTSMVDCETRAQAHENMCILAKAWIDRHLEELEP